MSEIIGNYSFELVEGDLWSGFMVRITTKETLLDPDFPVDLTGCSAFMNISTVEKVRGKKVELSTFNGGITITDPTDGVVLVNEQKIPLPDGVYEHSFMIKFPDGKRKTYFKGEVNVIHNNTTKNR